MGKTKTVIVPGEAGLEKSSQAAYEELGVIEGEQAKEGDIVLICWNLGWTSGAEDKLPALIELGVLGDSHTESGGLDVTSIKLVEIPFRSKDIRLIEPENPKTRAVGLGVPIYPLERKVKFS